jgi:glyoxylase-like metal-dependent hydrolase (beta-lactamase superfamily II)
MSELLDSNWDVFVTPGIPNVTRDLPPGAKQRLWPPMSSTLISGKRDAVLVDAFITVEQAGALVDWVAASGKNLTTIYATHGHGDHSSAQVQFWNDFRAPALLRRPT